ncbi:MAG: ribosome silencing factor, partial [Deltaproteobacteria bacterium]|nr:ribosome silencing factor [Deltaproteobacteria bacterium]
HIKEKMDEAGYSPIGIEGYTADEWILMDYDDIVIHVFHKPAREFYDLERLWTEAPRITIVDEQTLSDYLNSRELE